MSLNFDLASTIDEKNNLISFSGNEDSKFFPSDNDTVLYVMFFLILKK